MSGHVYYWLGKPLEDMTKEELIEAVKELAADNEQLRKHNASQSISHMNQMAKIAGEWRTVR